MGKGSGAGTEAFDGRDLERTLRRLGCLPIPGRQQGSHQFWVTPTGVRFPGPMGAPREQITTRLARKVAADLGHDLLWLRHAVSRKGKGVTL